MEKISAQFEAQTRQNRQLQLGQPITRNIESDPNIRSNMSSKFSNPIQPGWVRFGPKTDPAWLVDSPIQENYNGVWTIHP